MKKMLYVRVSKLFIIALGLAIIPVMDSHAKKHDASHLFKKSKKLNPAKELVTRNWGIDNLFDSHINAKKAWKISRGSKKIIVAVVDTGIDPNHPDLKDNLWRKAGSDEYGWDFVLNKKNPKDSHGHGTHVSGIVGATAKSQKGAFGVAPNVSIMAIRYFSEKSSGAENLQNTIKAFNYAIKNGAHIINYSGGGVDFSAGELRAMREAQRKGVLVVAAAGNEHSNTDKASKRYYPAAYGLSNIISVAATNIHNKLLPSSNWGKKSVDVAAPGEHIFSTIPKGKHGFLTGTSQSTAFVTGLAALILSENPLLKPAEVKSIIKSSVDKIAGLKNKISSGGRINAYAALSSMPRANSSKIKLAQAKRVKVKAEYVHSGLLTQPSFDTSEQNVVRKVAKDKR